MLYIIVFIYELTTVNNESNRVTNYKIIVVELSPSVFFCFVFYDIFEPSPENKIFFNHFKDYVDWWLLIVAKVLTRNLISFNKTIPSKFLINLNCNQINL